MGDASRQAHWENVYTTKGENEVSWFQQSPAPSLELIVQAGATRKSAIIDIGGGASRLVDHLVEQGFVDVTVLDLSGAALAAASVALEPVPNALTGSSRMRRLGSRSSPTTSGTTGRRSTFSPTETIAPPTSPASDAA